MGAPVNQQAACRCLATGSEMTTVKMDFQHDFRLPVVTDSQRASSATHLDHSVCPLVFHTVKVDHRPSHIYVRVTSVIWWFVAAHFGDVAGLWNFQVHDWNTAKVAPPRDDGASPTSSMIQPRGVEEESSIASAVTGWRPEAEVPECRASDDVGTARELEFRPQSAARLCRARELGGERKGWEVVPSRRASCIE